MNIDFCNFLFGIQNICSDDESLLLAFVLCFYLHHNKLNHHAYSQRQRSVFNLNLPNSHIG